MPQFEIRPQEIYLLERYSSAEYFKELVDAFKNMLDAAAVTWLLDIDDTSYCEHQFYPKDLVDFARTQSKVVLDGFVA